MKKIISLLLVLMMVLSLAACGGNSGSSAPATNDTPAAEAPAAEAPAAAPASETISLRVWGAEEDQTLLAGLIEEFKAAHPDQTFDIQLGVESESTAKDTILTDIQAAADVFAFADDQLTALVNAGALLALDSNMDAALQAYAGKSLDDVKAANGAGSVAAATKNDTLYAFPMGGGNNYFLYYDASVISAEQAQSWETLLDAAAAAGKKVGMTLASGWYNASFFLGAGFITDRNDDGTTVVDWNGTSADGITGVQVVKAMQAIAGHEAFMAVADGDLSNQINGGQLAAVIDGTWDAGTVEANFGEYAATKLPTFDVEGTAVQQGCFSGFKLMGVNAFSENAGWAVILAEFLTNESSQTARFDARQLAPSNNNAAASDAVKANVAIAASAAQDAYGVVQVVGDNFWSPSASFGEQIAQGTIAADDAAIQSALDQLVEGITAPIG